MPGFRAPSCRPHDGRCENSAVEGGALGEIRTPDPQIRSLVLYPAELRAHRRGGRALAPPEGGVFTQIRRRAQGLQIGNAGRAIGTRWNIRCLWPFPPAARIKA